MALILLTLMFVQSSLGLLLPDQYRDADWIKTTWYGNDWITLVAAVPLLWLGTRYAARGSVRGLLLMLGIAGYAFYNYAFYLFGAALNVFFPLYVLSFLLGSFTLGLSVSHLDVSAVVRSFRRETPARVIGGYLVFMALGLTVVWLGMGGAFAFADRPTPIEPEAFKVVAALDLSLMVPALTVGGVLLWRRRPWGYLIATIASVQGALYLVVLSVNSVIVISRGFDTAPGELLIWGPLAVFTTVAAIVLLKSASGSTPALSESLSSR